MIDNTIIELLSCPLDPDTCLQAQRIVQKENIIDSGKLICPQCGMEYPIAAGIPDLFPGENIRNMVGEEEYNKWLSALETFTEWRKKTWSDPFLSKTARKATDELKEAFFKFAEIEGGMILDVGGAGGMVRRYLPDGSRYHGLDPLPIPDDVKHFPFVRGVGEFIPFRNGIFDSVLVLESLDHLISPLWFIGEAARVLKGGGKLYISQDISQPSRKRSFVEKLRNLAGYIAKGQFKEVAEKARMEAASRRKVNPEMSHTYRFTEGSLMELMKGKFDVVSVSSYGSSLFIRGCAI